MNKIGIVIPSYNEESTLGNIISKLKKFEFVEILVIDDGSSDKTSQIVRANNVSLIKHRRNKGKGICIKEGIKYFLEKKTLSVIFMDADGQHDPDEITKFINAAQDSRKKFIIGNRMVNPATMPKHRLTTNKLMSFLIFLLCGQHIPDTQCGYRLVKRDVLKKLYLTSENYEIESEMVLDAAGKNIKIYSIPISTIYQQETSKIKPVKDTVRFFRLVLKYLIQKC